MPAALVRVCGVSRPGTGSETVSVSCSIWTTSYGAPLLLHWIRPPRSPAVDVEVIPAAAAAAASAVIVGLYPTWFSDVLCWQAVPFVTHLQHCFGNNSIYDRFKKESEKYCHNLLSFVLTHYLKRNCRNTLLKICTKPGKNDWKITSFTRPLPVLISQILWDSFPP